MDKALLLSGFATFMLVFLRGFQQKNVHGNHYFMAAITSTAMSITDIAVVSFVIHHGWAVLPYTATGATLGIISSMWLHSRVVKKIQKSGVPAVSTILEMPTSKYPKGRQSCCGCESPNVTMEKGGCGCICHL